jgi:hypothetical protein
MGQDDLDAHLRMSAVRRDPIAQELEMNSYWRLLENLTQKKTRFDS